jgi:hypothetical protein
VVYFGKAPFFNASREQVEQSRGLILLILIAASLRFAIDLSQPLKQFLIKVLPETLDVRGKILEPVPVPNEEPA